MRKFILLLLSSFPIVAMAQWAVYDEEVLKEITKINNVLKINNELEKKFKSDLSSHSPGQDLTLGDGDTKALLKGLDTKFENLTDLSDEDKNKYIESGQDCGSNEPNLLRHYNACVGLRNLRLQTMKQSQALLKTLDGRRKQIAKLVTDSRGVEDKSGTMQRYHFELQALQALMQTDAIQLNIVMEGYKQREQIYAMQMVEAKRENDTGRLDLGKNVVRKKAVPFVIP